MPGLPPVPACGKHFCLAEEVGDDSGIACVHIHAHYDTSYKDSQTSRVCMGGGGEGGRVSSGGGCGEGREGGGGGGGGGVKRGGQRGGGDIEEEREDGRVGGAGERRGRGCMVSLRWVGTTW
jgi:hypothetical protein